MGQWTDVAYTYNRPTQTATVYRDGVQANTQVLAAPMNVFAVDLSTNGLPFRLGAQNNNDGTAGGEFASLAVAKIQSL